MDRSEWVWMPHAAHFICADQCRFHLATYVGGYIVSTVGEYFPHEGTCELLARSRGVTLVGQGDARRADYMAKIGFEDIGVNRKYETMVFPAQPQTKPYIQCCPWTIAEHHELHCAGANDANTAYENHLRLCAPVGRRAARPTGGRMNYYILDESGQPIRVDMMACMRWFETNHAQRRLAHTRIGDTEVSTVFLGIDHNHFDDGPPVLWESMIFASTNLNLHGTLRRYSTQADARAGHDALVAHLRAAATDITRDE